MIPEARTGAAGGGGMRRQLAAAPTVATACDVVVEALAGSGFGLPAIYLAQGDRLRCMAQRGYWVVLDGFSPDIGVIGTTYRTGLPVLIADVGGAPDYLEAAPAVTQEACVPIRLRGSVVGVVNVESDTALPGDVLDTLAEVADALAQRFDELGGLPRESAQQQLVRHAVHLAGLTDVAAIEHHLVEAARQLAGMETGLVVALHQDPPGEGRPSGRPESGDFPRISAAAGRLAGPLWSLPPAVLSTIGSWVASGLSCYTVGMAEGEAFVGHELFRAAGAGSLLALPIGTSRDQRAVVILADRRTVFPTPSIVELLELLATLASACLRTALTTQQLRDRAGRDPLTGLGHHGSFYEQLAGCLTSGGSGAVAVLDLDGFKHVNDSEGHSRGDAVLREVAVALRDAVDPSAAVFRIGGDEFAVLLPRVRPDQLEEIGRRLCAAVDATGTVTTSVGIAATAAGEGATQLFARVDKALYAAKAAGRNRVALAAPAS